MFRRSDGSVFSANNPHFAKKPRDFGIRKVLLTAIHYVESKVNPYHETTTPEVVYDGIMLGGLDEGTLLRNIRDAAAVSGENYNFSERIYRVCSRPISEVAPDKQDGTLVYVAFIGGDEQFPIIVGRAKNALDRTDTGATKTDGPRRRWQYNGLFFEINKNGEMSIKRKGGKFKEKEGYFEPVKDGDEVSMQWTEKKVSFNIGKEAIKQVWDGESQTYTLTMEGGAEVKVDGKGKKINIKAGSTECEIDGNSGKISLKGEFVDLGSSVSDFVTLFTEMATAFNSHTHPFNYSAGPSPAMGVSQPPAAPLPVSVGSQTVAVQK